MIINVVELVLNIHVFNFNCYIVFLIIERKIIPATIEFAKRNIL